MSQLKPEDSGVYKLLCRNQSGEISCSCRLMVYETIKEELVAPLFTMPIKGKSFDLFVVMHHCEVGIDRVPQHLSQKVNNSMILVCLFA